MSERTKRRYTRRLLAGVGSAALLAFVVAATPALAELHPSATVRLDFEEREGELLHTERLNNFSNPLTQPELRPGDVAFFNEHGLHGDVQRVWVDDDATEGTAHDELCNPTTKKCDFSSIDGYLRDASSLSDRLLLVPMAYTSIRDKRPPAETKAMLKLIIKGLKARYPKIEYIEAFNEPDYKFYGRQVGRGETPILQPEELYPYYVPVYEVVNEINRELRPTVPLKVGGPAFTYINERFMEAFLDGYAADRNPEKRLDFISYHGYGDFAEDFRSFHYYKQNPSEVATQRARIDKMLADRRISAEIPTFITETGLYPGPSFDVPGVTDYARQAAGTASLHYWYADQPKTYPFHWVVRHKSRTESRKDQLVTLTPSQPDQSMPRTFTPYGNLMLMQSKMKDTRVSAVSDSLKAGQGVYAVASKDEEGASIMVWNYQHINEGRFQTTIDMTNLPANLRNGPVRLRAYRIDQTTSNWFTNPTTGKLQLVNEKTIRPGSTLTEHVDLGPNAIYLILLEPIRTPHR